MGEEGGVHAVRGTKSNEVHTNLEKDGILTSHPPTQSGTCLIYVCNCTMMKERS